ncbi:MAG: RluA family pseudouridine synthase [Planctomycetes bacterium]|nr:RluA family pseudouridine synthase [Planctomycetota bacterium]
MLPKYPGEPPRDHSKRLEQVKVLVDARLADQRLDLALATVLTWRSRASIHRLIRAGCVKIAGREVAPSRRVRAGDTIVIDIPPEARVEPGALQAIDFPIVYEDEWMVAVDKPAGVAVHPSGRHLSGTLIHVLHERYRRSVPEHDVVPRLLHRIDIETSGVVAVGLDEQFHHLVSRQFEDRQVQKTYLAVVHGRPPHDAGVVDLPMLPDKTSTVRLKLTARAGADGLPAVTHYRRLRGNERYSLIEVKPKTGRTHQIRVHMAALGCPLVGDKLYGADESLFLHQIAGTLSDEHRAQLVLDRHALHSHSLTFFHPMRDQEVTVTAPLPEDLLRLVP